MAKKTIDGELMEFNAVRSTLRKKIMDCYGSIAKFLNSEKGKEFGGAKIKVYLYDTGPVNFDVISALCEFFGVGILTRKICVSRRFVYRLNNTPTDRTKTAKTA